MDVQLSLTTRDNAQLIKNLYPLYLHDLDKRDAFHQAWMEFFPENPPARIAVCVADANAAPGGKAHYALDVIALAP